MDLKAASNQNLRTDRLTSVSIAVCFLVTVAVALATLAVAHPIERQTDMPLVGSSLSQVVPLFASFPGT
jgi:hypothetical protein